MRMENPAGKEAHAALQLVFHTNLHTHCSVKYKDKLMYVMCITVTNFPFLCSIFRNAISILLTSCFFFKFQFQLQSIKSDIRDLNLDVFSAFLLIPSITESMHWVLLFTKNNVFIL